MNGAILRVNSLSMSFGGLVAVSNLLFELETGGILAVIGPNGAGKTTLFNCLTGVYRPTAGVIELRDKGGAWRRLNGLKPNQFTEAGIARTFQNVRLFKGMTALENVMIARHCRTRTGIAGAIFRTKRARKEERECVAYAYQMLDRLGLAAHADSLASSLPYAHMRRLEIARALATEPKVLMLDEPAAGMNPYETDQLEQLILDLQREHKFSLLLIEHDMRLVMSIAKKIMVLNYGLLLTEGTPEHVRSHPEVVRAYLGSGAV